VGANSAARRTAKRVFRPLLNDRTYQLLQGTAMAWDIWTGGFREPELELLPYALRESEAALDIGANYGLYCYHLARAVGAGGQVFAFEPVPFTYSTLRLIARLLRLSNVQLIAKGCSDRNARLAFEVPVQASGALAAGLAYLAGRNNAREGRERHFRLEKTREVECEVVRVDDEVPAGAPVTLIKCDIEGAELLALRGARATIERHLPSVICEINPWFLEGFGITLAELLAFFTERDYRLFWYDDVNRKLRPRSAAEVVEDNYLFVHPSRMNRFRALL
jgi:FkbM family methyltransferase